jgi:hypothetical protein
MMLLVPLLFMSRNLSTYLQYLASRVEAVSVRTRDMQLDLSCTSQYYTASNIDLARHFTPQVTFVALLLGL